MTNGDRADGGGAGGRDGAKLPLEELPNGTRKSKTGQQGVNMQEQKLKLQHPQQQHIRPSFRRKGSGPAPPRTPTLSGRVSVVPRRSVDSAAKPAPSPPSPASATPVAIRSKQSPPLSSTGSFGSLTSSVSDDGAIRSRGSPSLGGSTAGRPSLTGRRRKRTPKILEADMPEQLQEDAIECTARAIYENEPGNHEDIAATIKKDFDQLHGSKWHCIVGRHFGSFVTAESNHFVHLHLGKVAVLLFKA